MTPIKLNNIVRADKNLTGHWGIEKDWEWYYSFHQIEDINKELEKEWMKIPTLQDFLDSGFTKEWSAGNKQLADKLWLKISGCCDNDGILDYYGRYGYLGSVSEYNEDYAWTFNFDVSEGILGCYNKDHSFVCRPLVKNSDSSIWLFEKVCERATEHWAKLWAKAWYDLWKILLSKDTDDSR